MKYKVLLLEEVADVAVTFLQNAADCEIVPNIEGYDPTSIDAIIARGKLHVTSEMMDSMPRLKVISRCGVGVDNVNVAYATERNIQVINTPGVNADSVAEHTLGLIMMLQRKFYKSIKEVKNGNWQYRVEYDGDEIRGKTLGILGMGNIGQKVAKLANVFGMKVQYWNRKEKDLDYPYVSVNELIETSDVVSIHLPHTQETDSLVNKEVMGAMKRGVLLVNTARGPIVDEVGLIEYLRSGHVGGYGADIPRLASQDKDYELLKFENVLLTPHASSLTKRTFNELCRLAVSNAIQLIRGEELDERYKVNTLV